MPPYDNDSFLLFVENSLKSMFFMFVLCDHFHASYKLSADQSQKKKKIVCGLN